VIVAALPNAPVTVGSSAVVVGAGLDEVLDPHPAATTASARAMIRAR
jgi:hypothetical protein